MNLPEGMQEVNFDSCYGITGTAESRMRRFIFIKWFWRPARTLSFVPHILRSFLAYELPPFILPYFFTQANYRPLK